MIVPAFLFKYLFIFVDIRIKNCIQIDVYQVHKILVIRAGNWVHGFIRISHRIQKCVNGAFNKLNKRFFNRIFS